jgi:putative membrane-bound dehydrogenase-like protein
MKTILLFLQLSVVAGWAGLAVPVVREPGWKLELVAAEPEVRTPVGLAVDRAGNLYVVENHTHQVKPGYDGPSADRILIFRRGDGGRWESSVFAEGFRNAMVLKSDPDGVLHLTQRDRLLRLEDRAGDGRCDERVELMRWETTGDYPHNGLSGLAWSADGWIYVGSGENLQQRYVAVGKDGTRIDYTPGGANVFRLRRDGSGLEVVATGLWNGFGLEIDGDGRLFAVDNDPDSCPPNRLLHIEAGADYGFNMAYGRAGVHPFQCWDGEIAGTRGMVGGTGEAATDLLDLRKTGLRREGLHLLVTSWGDNQLELYRVGSGERGLRVVESRVVVKGDAGFRPVCLAAAPDGSVFVSDWADREYPVHGKGRIWRLSAEVASVVPEAAAVLGPVAAVADGLSPVERRLVAMRRGKESVDAGVVKEAMAGGEAAAVRLAMIVAGERRLRELRGDVEQALGRTGGNRDLFRTAVASLEMLGKAPGENPEGQVEGMLVRLAGEAGQAAAVRVMAMQSLARPRDHVRELLGWLRDGDEAVAAGAAAALAGVDEDAVTVALRERALAAGAPRVVRLEALVALAGRDDDLLVPLVPLLRDPALAGQAVRTLRGAQGVAEVRGAMGRAMEDTALPFPVKAQLALALGRPPVEIRPVNDEQWGEALRAGTGDPAEGRRVFFSGAGLCAGCHQVAGRGVMAGPDLSTIARSSGPVKLLESVLLPSREVGPLYAVRSVRKKDGSVVSGLLRQPGVAGRLDLVGPGGQVTSVEVADVAGQEESSASLMPEGLELGLTVQEFRDLMAWLGSLR